MESSSTSLGLVVLDIPRKATLAQVGETVVSRCFVGASGRRVNGVATAAVVVYVTIQATFGRPTHL